MDWVGGDIVLPEAWPVLDNAVWKQIGDALEARWEITKGTTFTGLPSPKWDALLDQDPITHSATEGLEFARNYIMQPAVSALGDFIDRAQDAIEAMFFAKLTTELPNPSYKGAMQPFYTDGTYTTRLSSSDLVAMDNDFEDLAHQPLLQIHKLRAWVNAVRQNIEKMKYVDWYCPVVKTKRAMLNNTGNTSIDFEREIIDEDEHGNQSKDIGDWSFDDPGSGSYTHAHEITLAAPYFWGIVGPLGAPGDSTMEFRLRAISDDIDAGDVGDPAEFGTLVSASAAVATNHQPGCPSFPGNIAQWQVRNVTQLQEFTIEETVAREAWPYSEATWDAELVIGTGDAAPDSGTYTPWTKASEVHGATFSGAVPVNMQAADPQDSTFGVLMNAWAPDFNVPVLGLAIGSCAAAYYAAPNSQSPPTNMLDQSPTQTTGSGVYSATAGVDLSTAALTAMDATNKYVSYYVGPRVGWTTIELDEVCNQQVYRQTGTPPFYQVGGTGLIDCTDYDASPSQVRFQSKVILSGALHIIGPFNFGVAPHFRGVMTDV